MVSVSTVVARDVNGVIKALYSLCRSMTLCHGNDA